MTWLTAPTSGVLSYYRDQADEGNVSRGSISMTVAKVDPPGPDKLKFVVGSKIDRAASVYLKGARKRVGFVCVRMEGLTNSAEQIRSK